MIMKHLQSTLEARLTDYLRTTIGLAPRIAPAQIRLPAFLEAVFAFRTTTLFGKDLLVCFPSDDLTLSPSELAEKNDVLRSKSGLDPVFVFETISSWDRARLVAKRVSFIVPGTQLYLPNLLVDMRERFPALKTTPDRLPWTAQFLLLYHLQRQSLAGESVRGLARRFGFSATTVSRSVAALEGLGLSASPQGKEKPLVFPADRIDLWQQSYPLLRSPVERRWYISGPCEFTGWVQSGETALSVLTDIDSGGVVCVAARSSAVRVHPLYASGGFRQRPSGKNETVVEAWAYDPRPLSRNGVVDACSLALALRDEGDARIVKALESAVRKALEW